MHHYVYYSYEEWGRGYIGVRSSNCLPEEDCLYLGSFEDKIFTPTCKIIISNFNSRVEAVKAEILLHGFYEVGVNPHFSNRSKQTSEGFDRGGVPMSKESIDKCRESYEKFRREKPDLYQKRKELALRGIHEYILNNPEKFEESKRARGRAGGAAMAALRKKDPKIDLMLRKAVSDSMQHRFTPEYQQMLINRARESTAKPVIVTYSDGSIEEFDTFTQCRLHLGVSAGCLHNKIKELPTRKLKGITVVFKNR